MTGSQRGILTETTTIADAMPVTFVRGPGRRALVIVPAAFGVTDDLRSQMHELAGSAALVATLNPFWREHPVPLPYTDFPGVMARLQALDRERLIADLRALVAWVAPQCAGVVGLGICFGGVFVFRLASEGLLDAVATWHAGRLEQHLDLVTSTHVPMALHFGGADRVVPPSAVAQVRSALADRQDATVVEHPGLDHGFSHPSAPPYDAAATEAALSSLRALLVRA